MIKEPLYAAKCIFRHSQLKPLGDKKYVYEERIILIKADNDDEAISQAEKEAKEYADDGTKYLEFVDVFNLYHYILTPGSELYSSMRSSDCEPDDYLSKYYDTGYEHSRGS